ncbi:MAG: DUF6094 domain-containing protein, partial [Chloroflexota bacterium]|nr:DUF6094 domain-containing protein [Chloroflexota bacterium]
MPRPESVAVGGYFPAPDAVIAPIAALIDTRPAWERHVDPRTQATVYPQYALLDPCAGDGAALAACGHALFGRRWPVAREGPGVRLYAAELEAARAVALRSRWESERGAGGLHAALHSDGFAVHWTTHTTAQGASLLWLNPPYDWHPIHGRLEEAFLQRFTPALTPGGGLLVFLIPYTALAASAPTLAAEYTDLHVYRFPDDLFGEFKQIVVLGRRRLTPLTLAGAGTTQVDHLCAWSADPTALPVLPPLGHATPVLTLAPAAQDGFGEWVAQPLDLTRLLPQLTPWTVGTTSYTAPPPAWTGVAGGHLYPVQEAGLHQPYTAFLQRQLPVAQPPKPAYLATMLASGLLNGLRCEPDDPASAWPPVLIKGRFHKEARTVEHKTNKKGEVTGMVQVQQPVLSVTVLTLTTTPTYYDLKAGSVPSAATTVAAMNIADLLAHYGQGLARLMTQQFPALHQPTDPAGLLPLPPTGRTPFTAQAHAVMTLLKLLAQGRNP